MFSDHNGMKLEINKEIWEIQKYREIKWHTLNYQCSKKKSQGQLENTLR